MTVGRVPSCMILIQRLMKIRLFFKMCHSGHECESKVMIIQTHVFFKSSQSLLIKMQDRGSCVVIMVASQNEAMFQNHETVHRSA